MTPQTQNLQCLYKISTCYISYSCGKLWPGLDAGRTSTTWQAEIHVHKKQFELLFQIVIQNIYMRCYVENKNS